MLEPTETYDSRLGGVANTMQGILRNICLQGPEVVFFAGRSSALGAFVQALPSRPCLNVSINVISGGSAGNFAAQVAQGDPELRNGLNANDSVRYAAQAHPGAWKASPESFSTAATSHFSLTCNSNCLNTVFPGKMLEDGGAIIGYDAIVTAVTAIGINDRPDLVSQELKRLHGTDAVPGATGWISLDPLGNPVNKAVPSCE